jgi:hypothetical protein
MSARVVRDFHEVLSRVLVLVYGKVIQSVVTLMLRRSGQQQSGRSDVLYLTQGTTCLKSRLEAHFALPQLSALA